MSNSFPNNKTQNNSVEEEYGETINTTVPSNESDNISASEKVIGAAAIAGGVAGLAISGPIVGLVGAVGVGALAATQSNIGGDVARASGDVVIAAGERAKEINKKHGIVEKTKRAAKGLVEKGKELDNKHQICTKTKNEVEKVVNKTKKFEEKHKIGEKAGNTMTKGLQIVSKTLKPKDK